MKNCLFLFLLIALLNACSSLPSAYSKAPGKISVVGKRNAGIKTRICFVNGRKKKAENKDKLTNQVWLYPGNHTLHVACVIGYPWGAIKDYVEVPLTIKMGYRYELQGHFDNKKPTVSIKKTPDWLE